MPTTLSVNLNAIAMLRNRRDLPWPSVEGLGRIALQSGASGLTVHPRPDQRHIRFSDLPVIRNLIDDEFPDAEFNIEGYPTDEFLELCAGAAAEQVTLVRDDPSQATSDHGWDFRKHAGLSDGRDCAAEEDGHARIAVCRWRRRCRGGGDRQGGRAPTGSNSIRVLMAAATIRPSGQGRSSRRSARRRMRRWRSAWASMRATI